MTDERLRLSMPDDQVCAICQAVTLDMSTHLEWHEAITQHINRRVAGVERHMRATAQQAMDLIGIEQRDREAAVDDHAARMAGIERSLSGVWPRLRGIEDELSSSHNAFRAAPARLPDMTDEEYEAAVAEMTKPVAMVGQPDTAYLPPPVWDRHGMRWSPVRVNSDVMWEAPMLSGMSRTTMTELDAKRGPLRTSEPDEAQNDPGDTNEETSVEETAGEMLARLGTDAVKWAEDFVRSVSAHDDDYEVDQVLTWFANAIEAGRSAGQQQQRDQLLYDVAACNECATAGRSAILCHAHSAMVQMAHAEVHGQ